MHHGRHVYPSKWLNMCTLGMTISFARIAKGPTCFTERLIGSDVALSWIRLVEFTTRIGNWLEVEQVDPIISKVRRVIRILYNVFIRLPYPELAYH